MSHPLEFEQTKTAAGMNTECSTGLCDPTETAPDEKREKLPMEKKFDKWVYGGISYFAQAATGVVLSRWLVEGGGRKYYHPIADWMAKNVIEKVTSHRGDAAIEQARSKVIVTTMIMVGNCFLFPVKWLENRKPAIVRDMTDKDNARREAQGETITPEEKAHQKELLYQLEHHPKQSWWSLLGGRAFGLGGVYATLFALGEHNNQRGENAFADGVQGLLKTAGAKQLADSPTLRSYAKITANDFFYSIVSAGGLYIYSHFICPPKKKNAVTRESEPLPLLANPLVSPLANEPMAESAAQQPPPASHADKAPRRDLKPKPAPEQFAEKLNQEPAAAMRLGA